MPASMSGCSIPKRSVRRVRIGPPKGLRYCTGRSRAWSHCGRRCRWVSLRAVLVGGPAVSEETRLGRQGVRDPRRGVVRYRWVVVVLWLVGTGVASRALPSLGSQVNDNNSAFLPAKAPSLQAAKLAEPLSGPVDQTLVQVVAVSKDGNLSAADQARLQSLADALRRVRSVDLVQFAGVSPDGAAAQLVVLSRRSPNDIGGDKKLIGAMGSVVSHYQSPALQIHLAG